MLMNYHIETVQDAMPIIWFFLITAMGYTMSVIVWMMRFERKNKAIWHLPEVQNKVHRKVMIFGATIVSWIFLMMLVLKILSNEVYFGEVFVLVLLPLMFVLLCILGIKKK